MLQDVELLLWSSEEGKKEQRTYRSFHNSLRWCTKASELADFVETLSQKKYQKVKWKMNEGNLLRRMEEFFSSLWGSRSASCINPGEQHCHWPEASPLQRLSFAATEGCKGVEPCYFTLIKCVLFREQKSRGPFLRPKSTCTTEDPEIRSADLCT